MLNGTRNTMRDTEVAITAVARQLFLYIIIFIYIVILLYL